MSLVLARGGSPDPTVPYTTFQIVRNGLWAFAKGFTDSLRGAIDLFYFDYRRTLEKNRKLEQKELEREALLNRDSPARDIEFIAKRRAIERREREKQKAHVKSRKKEPHILERTLKCGTLNTVVFMTSIFVFEYILLPLARNCMFFALSESEDTASSMWSFARPILTLCFSTLWVLPLFLLSKVVNAIWFQDIADLSIQASGGRPVSSLSLSVMVADTFISIVIEAIFLIQGVFISMLPIKILGYIGNMVHICLLYSLYSFEYKWFAQGLPLNKRLNYIETNWPYFIGFGIPLAIITSIPSKQVISACVFSSFFPLFIVSASKASVVASPGIPPLNIFAPTINISGAIINTFYRLKWSGPEKNSVQ